jgi:LemA protein
VAIEDDLQYARRFYNGSVRDYRNLAQTFPSNLMAGLFAFAPGDFFEVEPSLRQTAPSVRL